MWNSKDHTFQCQKLQNSSLHPSKNEPIHQSPSPQLCPRVNNRHLSLRWKKLLHVWRVSKLSWPRHCARTDPAYQACSRVPYSHPPSRNWTPYTTRDFPATAFLTIAQDDTQSLILHVLSCPLPIPGQSPQFMMNVSGPAAFTHTHDPITAATFTSGDIEFTKTKFTHEPSQLCSVRLPLTAAEKKEAIWSFGRSWVFQCNQRCSPFQNLISPSYSLLLPYQEPKESHQHCTSPLLAPTMQTHSDPCRWHSPAEGH